jgi:hypothetical protein
MSIGLNASSFIFDKRHLHDLSATEVEAFLTDLAVEGKDDESTQIAFDITL